MPEKDTEQKEKKDDGKEQHTPLSFPPRLVTMFADEIAKTVVSRLPHFLPKPRRKKAKRAKKIENGIFLDTSAIIDGRIFDVIHLGLLNGMIVITEGVLLELKHIADAQDTVKRERGRRGLEFLEKLKKARGIKVHVLDEDLDEEKKPAEVDERIIKIAKLHRGKIITCDYNLEKKASIQNVTAINVNALANSLKVTAVPGQASHIKIQHPGKDATQGVGYLDDGTMIVVENGVDAVGKSVDVVVSRVIQTATGRILFAKRI